LPALGIEPNDVERLAAGNLETPALAHRVADHTFVPAEHPAIDVDDITRLGGSRAKALDEVGISAGGNKADVLAVWLCRHRQVELAGKLAHLRLAHATEGEPEALELLARGREEEVALVAVGIDCSPQLRSVRPVSPLNIV